MKAELGNTVSVKYTGKLTDGTIFDETDNENPFVFTLGENMVIPGFENGILGMSVGESKTINISVDDAYGPHSEDLIFTVDKEDIQVDDQLQVGDVLEMPMPEGNSLFASIVEIGENEVSIDANHELAGEDLIFEVEILSIN
ncbi:peptidylprolyl isomerase [Candidatus Kapaibacterium sp.]